MLSMKKIIYLGAVVLMAMAATACKDSSGEGETGGSLTVGGKTYDYDYATAFILPMQGEDMYNILVYLSNFEIRNMTDLKAPQGAEYDLTMILYVSDIPDVSTCSIRPFPAFDPDAELKLPVWQMIASTGILGTSDPDLPDFRYYYSSERLLSEETPENVEAVANEPDLNITKNGSTYRIETTDMLLRDEGTGDIVKVSFNYNGPMRIVEYDENVAAE